MTTHHDDLTRLHSVLKRTGDMAREASITGMGANSATYLIQQHNRILARLTDIDPSVKGLFDPLPDDTPLDVIAFACHQIAAYFEPALKKAWTKNQDGRFYESVLDMGPFKIMMGKDFDDLKDLGKTIKEAMKHEKRERKRHRRRSSRGSHWAPPPPNPPHPPHAPHPPHPPHHDPAGPGGWGFYDDEDM